MDANRKTLQVWLRDAHAMERANIDNLERQARRFDDYPLLQQTIVEHLAQSREQLRRVEDCLRRLGTEPSRVKDAATRLSGIAEVWMAGVAPDEVVKHVLANHAYKHFEIASYTALAAAAEACGEPEIQRACEEILEEERVMADWLKAHLPDITREYLQRHATATPDRGRAPVGRMLRGGAVPVAVAAAGLGLAAVLGTRGLRRPRRVGEVMTRRVDLVDPNTRIQDAAARMRDDNVGALPVGENDRLVGMVTDRDIAVRAVAEGRSPSATTVRDVMSERIYYCFDDESLDAAAKRMAQHQVHRLPVMNRDKRLIGIVALADLGRASGAAAQRAVQGISEPTGVPRR